jgi:hypothetical protein
MFYFGVEADTSPCILMLGGGGAAQLTAKFYLHDEMTAREP